MGKTKRKYNKITDAAAKAVDKWDELQIRFYEALPKFFAAIVSLAAKSISYHDVLQERFDRLVLILHFRLASTIHNNKKKIAANKSRLMAYFSGFVLIAIAVLALFNYATGFKYSYNGRDLGYVNNQEDVIKILDFVSDELTKEYGSKISIDKDNDIKFKKVVTLDKEIDDIDTVLRRLTYMTDMEAEASGIYADGKLFVCCESREVAEEVLNDLKNEYLEEENKNREYSEAGFKEKIEIKPVTTKLAYISSREKALKKIMTGGSKREVYVVKEGDTYSGIFSRFNTDFDSLKKVNPDLDIDSLYPGDEIVLQKETAAFTVKTVEKSTFSEKVKYKTEHRKSKSMYVGDKKVIQKGQNGRRTVTAIITRENGEEISRKILKSETTEKPVKQIVVEGTKEVPKTAPTGQFIYPVSGATLSSPFGWRWGRLHEGIDLACATGTTIRASDGGTVVRAGWYGGYGLCIEISHGGGKLTRYGHCSSVNVSVGEQVYQGQKIGEVGNTGNSYGSHCHFEIRINNSPVDPLGYL